MLYLFVFINIIAIITFSVQIIITLRSHIERLMKVTMMLYLSTLLLWQFSALGIFLLTDVGVIEFLYRCYAVGSTGFLFFFLPLTFAIDKHRRAKLAFGITFSLYIVNIVVNIIHNPISSLYPGEFGYFLPHLESGAVITNVIVIFFFIGGILHCLSALNKCRSAVSRQRQLYFLAASIVIFIGLTFNLTPFKEYPIDIICAMLGGLLIAYAILARKLLSVRKSFFRGALNSTLLTAMVGFYILLTLIFTRIFDKDFPAYTVFPVAVSFLIFLIITLRRKKLQGMSVYNRLHFSSSTLYQDNFESYNLRIKNELRLDEIFKAFFSLISSDFDVDRGVVFIYSSHEEQFKFYSGYGIMDSAECPVKISRYSGILDIFKQESIIVLNNLDIDRRNEIDSVLSKIFTVKKPDVLQLMRLADEPAGIICLSLTNDANRFIDREDQEYLTGLNSITSDAIARALAHEQLVMDVSHKENLIKDINHRVKNNLQMISGLLYMQEMTADDEEVRAALQTARGRVETIAKVHELLYTGGVVEQIRISDYLNEIVKGLRMQMRAECGIKFITEVPEIMLETEKALTFCMVVNELMSNAVKYAFIPHESGEIRLEVKIQGNELNCLIQDNGSGFEHRTDKDMNSTGLGHNLVKTFVEKQLKGSWRVEGNDGTAHFISFPVKN